MIREPNVVVPPLKRDETGINGHRAFDSLFGHDLRKPYGFVARENRSTLCANAALRVRIMPYVNRLGCCRVARSCASTAATAVMFSTPRAVTEGVRIWAGRAGPIRIGPTGTASARTLIM